MVAEASHALAAWRVRARYPEARVLKTIDITEVAAGQVEMVSDLSPVAVDGHDLLGITCLRRANERRMTA